ncbi:MAG TPA: PAC2 family protein [Syntrophales bacterium]|nr:PAC2 family protein [Syntrophales bacterium]
MEGRLVMSERPQLSAPYIIVGLNGWLNAGEVSTGSIDYLRRKSGASKFAYVDTQGFYIYQIPSSNPEQTLRPITQISEGLVRKLESPKNEIFFWKSGSEHDLILFLGVEPNLNWPQYCQVILDLARQFQAPRIYCVGAFFDQVPHTRKTRIHVTVSHQRMRSEFKTFAQFGDYAGPSSFTTMLIALGHEQGIEVAGISARAPIYIQELNSKACYDLLKNILNMTGLRIDLRDLRQDGQELVEMMDRAFSENSTALAQLKQMEEVYDGAFGKEPPAGPDESDDELMEEVLRMKREGRKPH